MSLTQQSLVVARSIYCIDFVMIPLAQSKFQSKVLFTKLPQNPVNSEK